MTLLRFGSQPKPTCSGGQLKETYELLRITLKGKRIASVTEARYVGTERRLFAKMGERLQLSADVVSYSQFMENPKSVEADIILLRTSKLFVVSLPEILHALEGFRRENPGSAIIASVLDRNAFDVLTSRPDLVNMVDTGAATNDHELLRKGAEVLERIS